MNTAKEILKEQVEDLQKEKKILEEVFSFVSILK